MTLHFTPSSAFQLHRGERFDYFETTLSDGAILGGWFSSVEEAIVAFNLASLDPGASAVRRPERVDYYATRDGVSETSTTGERVYHTLTELRLERLALYALGEVTHVEAMLAIYDPR